MSAEMERIRCVIMRGGTSRAVFVKEADMPRDPELRRRVILALFGTPDRRQIDGLGGADVLTSKFAMIGPPSRADADVDYTFAQVGVERATLDFHGNCGNISTAVGPYAIEEGFVRAVEPITRVRVHNTNTKKILIAEVPVVDGLPAVEGDCEISGVPGTGARVYLDYSQTMGAVTEKFFPTGHVVDLLDDVGSRPVRATLSDMANPVVYVKATDLGLTGIESVDEYDNNPKLKERLEYIRGQAAVLFGLTDHWSKALLDCSLFPLLTVVHPPASYPAFGSDKTVSADEIDIVVRMEALQQLHKTYAGTGTANLGPTALVPGTVVNDVLTQRAKRESVIRFGHPMGVSKVEAAVDRKNGEWIVTRAAYERTARRIMEGYAYVRRSRLTYEEPATSQAEADRLPITLEISA